MNVGTYIEAEGFLSTSLIFSTANKFDINLDMKIDVPVSNLKGMFDNGFAHLYKFSRLPDEQ